MGSIVKGFGHFHCAIVLKVFHLSELNELPIVVVLLFYDNLPIVSDPLVIF